MLIRSYDKKVIINLNNIDSICIEQNYCGCGVVSYNGGQESRVCFGEYSTEEKAIKVLDMICDFATQKRYEEIIPKQFGFISGQVFQMPSDEEVEV